MKITQSSIRLHDMRFYAYHGVMEQERRVGGEYLVSLQVETDLSRAVNSDSALTVSVTKCNPPMGADCKGASVEMRIEK